MIADNAIYVDGRRAAQQPSSLQETYEALRQLDDGVDLLPEKTGSPSFSVQHKWAAASLVSYNAGYVLIEETLHDAVAQSTRPPTRERRH